ncbi:MAG: cell wall hydrolase [Sphingomonadales bacterium]|nr:cell wall hydrolase [Sphingomonadales bacterium]
MDRDKAELVNAGIPVSKAPIEPARPFVSPLADVIGRQTAADCLTAAIYYEAASENAQGQRAVAQVVLNRVRHPAFPKTVCGVVYQGSERSTGCQFTFTCDGSLARKPTQEGWLRARSVALAALAGAVERSVGTATHYHTIWVVPYWAWSLDKITTLGAHIFYRWPGYWGRRAAFNGTYAGETDAAHAGDVPYVSPDLSGDSIWAADKPDTPKLQADEHAGLPADNRKLGNTTAAPRADENQGRLVADENAGALLGPAPAAPTKGN